MRRCHHRPSSPEISQCRQREWHPLRQPDHLQLGLAVPRLPKKSQPFVAVCTLLSPSRMAVTTVVSVNSRSGVFLRGHGRSSGAALWHAGHGAGRSALHIDRFIGSFTAGDLSVVVAPRHWTRAFVAHGRDDISAGTSGAATWRTQIRVHAKSERACACLRPVALIAAPVRHGLAHGWQSSRDVRTAWAGCWMPDSAGVSRCSAGEWWSPGPSGRVLRRILRWMRGRMCCAA
jgi:hypothetical protein